ncbi:MAG: 16S rRNA (cytidine(1402)-2'-O)-methyltransferase [Erysipelotrichaceae bacterium]|nr:16S rRNA (cytidine(1402)-2'-O)-methyltransferase [Erysipelotrichaceae bacterium]
MKRTQSFLNDKATLYVIATPIGNLKEISSRVIEALNDVSYVFCEDTRVTLQLLSYLSIKKNVNSAYENIEKQSSSKIIKHLKNHENVAFMSDAGYPAISDPGQMIIKDVIDEGFNVVVVNGPSALIHSVIASGFETNHFYFYGFLDPQKGKRIKELESLKDFPHTMIFYQSPHKILACLNDMLEVLGDRQICVCRELTKKFEEFIRGSISEIIPICETFKGEMVVVVKGNDKEEIKEVSLDDLLNKVDELIKNNLSKSDAIKQVAKENQVDKKKLYQYYHLKGEK